MNQSDRICGVMSRAARGVVAVVCLAVLCGCGTMLAKVRSIASDEVLYLVKGALGETEAQREAAVRIVEDQLDDRLERTAVPEGTRELALWRAREEALEEPVVIDGESYKSAPELRNVSDRDRVATYVSTHPEALSLSGSEYSEAWETALSEAKAKASSLEIERKQLLKQADAAVSAKDHLKALVAYAAALEITPGEKDLVNKSVQSASDAWKGVKDGMEKNVLAKAETLKDSPVEWDEFQKNLLTKQDQVLDYLRSVNSVKVGGKALLTDERRKEAAALLQQSSEALAGVWQKYGDYLVGRSDYWMFYKFIAACLESAETKPALKSGTLAEKVRGMYVANLGDGMKHFIDTASAAYDRDQYGVSYVFCLMAEEMLDFARAKDMKVPSDATDKLEFARSIEKDATEKIAAQHNRRLLILDFLPAVTEEGGQVAYQARTLCNKKYEPANDLAWRLTVPQGKILTQNMVEPLDPADTVISGEIKEITINAAPVREYDQEFIEVGSPNIIEVVNPMYKIRENQPRTIWQQEVAKFYRVKREHKKEGVITLTLTSEKADAPSVSLLSLTERFPGEAMPLKELTLQCEEIAFANPISGTPRTSTVRDDLKVDPYPQSVPVKLTSDKEIQKAVLDFALNEIDKAIEKLVVQYPVTTMAAQALEAERAGDNAATAEQWGQFILYTRKLTESALGDAEKESISWTALRGKLEGNLAKWADARWKNGNGAVLKALPGVWESTTEAALLTLSSTAAE